MAQELDYGRVERLQPTESVETPPVAVKNESGHNRPGFLTFIAMVLTAIVLDVGSVLPIIGSAVDLLALLIFIPWFYFSGMKFTGKRIGLIGLTTVLEALPVVQMAPFLTLNVIVAYWMNGN